MSKSIKYEKNGMLYEDILQPYSEEEKQENEINRSNAQLVFNFRYLVIPREILEMGLGGNETLILSFIHSFLSQNGGRFYFSNNTLAEIFNLSEIGVSNILKRLSDAKHINLSYKRKANGGQIRFVTLPTYKNFEYQVKESVSSNLNKIEGNNNKINNNKIYTYTPPLFSSQNGSERQTDTQQLSTSSIDILKEKEILREIARTHRVLEDDVRDLALELRLYCQSKGRKYKNYVAALRAWVVKEKKAGKIEEVDII